jgi:hypothetical protein
MGINELGFGEKHEMPDGDPSRHPAFSIDGRTLLRGSHLFCSHVAVRRVLRLAEPIRLRSEGGLLAAAVCGAGHRPVATT